jgi:hypothetical protein
MYFSEHDMRPAKVVDRLIEEIKEDRELWAQILDRELESKKIDDLAKARGKNPEWDWGAFPEPKYPTRLQLINNFVECVLGKADFELGSQLEAAIRPYAKRELGL